MQPIRQLDRPHCRRRRSIPRPVAHGLDARHSHDQRAEGGRLAHGSRQEVASEEVVIDDVFELAPGDQIVVDGEVLRSDGLSVDESLLTGESAAVDKADGDDVKSGSFVTAGGGVARATAVGDDSYAARLTAEAKRFRAPKSETAKGIDRILGLVTWAIAPAAVMLYFGQRASEDEIASRHADRCRRRRRGARAAGTGAAAEHGPDRRRHPPRPQAGARPATAGGRDLARVTVLASDKTGTLTTGAVTLENMGAGRSATASEPARDGPIDAPSPPSRPPTTTPTPTMKAIQVAHPDDPGWPVVDRIPFDSAHKYSAVEFDDGWRVVRRRARGPPPRRSRRGATGRPPGRRRAPGAAARRGQPRCRTAGVLPDDLSAAAPSCCSPTRIRPDAADTIDYFCGRTSARR